MVLGSRILAPGRADGGRHAALQERLQPFPHRGREPTSSAQLSECHTGYRAFSARVAQTLPFLRNSDDFVFDNQVIAQAVAFEHAGEGGAGLDASTSPRPPRRTLTPEHRLRAARRWP